MRRGQYLQGQASTTSASIPGGSGLLSPCPWPCSLMRRAPLLPLGAGAGGPCERPGSAFWLGAPVCPLRAPARQSQCVSATAPLPASATLAGSGDPCKRPSNREPQSTLAERLQCCDSICLPLGLYSTHKSDLPPSVCTSPLGSHLKASQRPCDTESATPPVPSASSRSSSSGSRYSVPGSPPSRDSSMKARWRCCTSAGSLNRACRRRRGPAADCCLQGPSWCTKGVKQHQHQAELFHPHVQVTMRHAAGQDWH